MINTNGGSGHFINATGAIISNHTLFTTPATADYMYLVTIDVWNKDGGTGAITLVRTLKIKAGPAVDIKILAEMGIGTTNLLSGVGYTYNYLGVKVI